MADIQPPAPVMQQMNDLNMSYDGVPGNPQLNPSVMQPGVDQQLSQTFTDSTFDMSGQDPIDISDFLMTDLERPTHGCCCGGES